MRKKILSMVLFAILLTSTFTVLPFTAADLEDDIEVSIRAGIEWLVLRQDADGGWED